jgi:hypothetical protein
MGYVLFMITHCARDLTARARARERLANTFTHLWTDSLQICRAHTTDDTSYMGYTLIFTHRGNTRERACASARLINCSLIYGRFHFRFGVNILHLTPSSKGYVLFMFTHRTARLRASARVRARAWFNSQLSLDGFSSNLMGTYYK